MSDETKTVDDGKMSETKGPYKAELWEGHDEFVVVGPGWENIGSTFRRREAEVIAEVANIALAEGFKAGRASPNRLKTTDWNEFDRSKGSEQNLPTERKFVLVEMAGSNTRPKGIAVGYLKYGAGDKESPYFVVPGLHTGRELAWCDCLPDNFEWRKCERG